jgi:AcrR family transcriptional regulator
MSRRRTQTHERIIATATALFAEQGYGAVTLEKVADSCGLARRTIYRHFESRDALLIEAMLRVGRLDLARIEHIVQEEPEPIRALVWMTEHSIAAVRDNPGWKLVFERLGHVADGSLRNELHAILATGQSYKCEIFRRCQAAGHVIPGDPRAIAFTTMSVQAVKLRLHYAGAGVNEADVDMLIRRAVSAFLTPEGRRRAAEHFPDWPAVL